VVNPTQLAHNEGYLGQVIEVMVDGESDEPGQYTGRTDDYVLVHFESEKPLAPGDVVQVEIVGCKSFYVKGRLC